MNKVMEFKGHSKPIVKFILSSDFIFSLAQDGEFIIFNIKTAAIVKRKKFDCDFDVMVHPTTYINKLIFAGSNRIELWNIIDDSKVYNFPKILTEKDKTISITSIVQSPVIHVVAIGYSNGEI
jgi:U3 small nucleolar RNA-associated protein 21